MSLAASAAVGVHVPVTGTRGLSSLHRCCNFRPRASAFRLQRQQLPFRTSCSTTSPAQQLPIQQPKLHPAAATFVAVWQHVLQQMATLLQKSAPERLSKEASSDEINASIRSGIKHMRCLMAVAPFAAATGSASTFLLITKAVGSFIKLYLLFLFLRVLLSWFPAFGWDKQPWLALRQITDPYLNLFRGIVPPLLGTIDFTPLFGFLILQFLAGALDVGSEDEW